MAKGSKKERPAPVSVRRPRAQHVAGPPAPARPSVAVVPAPPAARPAGPVGVAAAAALLGAKKIKKKCCRSTPRCKGCPVVLMRTARLQESGLTGKDLKKAVKRARAA
jgi:hypothetical protein